MMRFLISALAIFSVSTTFGQQKSVTFLDAFEAAKTKTEAVPFQESRLRQADAVAKEAKSQLLPDLSLNGNYTRYDEAGGETLNREFARSEQRSARITLEQALYNHRLYKNLDSARADRSAERFRLQDAHLLLYSEVARRYYEVQIAESDVKNLKATIELNNSRIKDLRSRTRIGRSRTGDLLTAESQLAVLEANLQVASGQLAVARASFAQVTGLPSDVTLTEPPKTAVKLESIDSYLKTLEERPDLKALDQEIKSARESVSAAKAGHWPRFGLTGNYYIEREGSSEGVDWDLSVGLTIPLYSGGEIVAQTRQAKEREVQAELALRRERRLAEANIRNAYAVLTSTIEQVRALSTALVATERNYREQSRDYRLSLVTNLDVVQALNSFHETKRAHDRAVISASMAYAQLEAATAKLPVSTP